MIKRINLKVFSIVGLVLIAIVLAGINYPPIISLWEGSVMYNSFKPLARLPVLAIQSGGDSVGFHGHGYAFLMVARYVADIFGHSLYVARLLPVLYGLISAFLLYVICKRWFNWKVAAMATALLITNINFLYYQHALMAQIISLAVVLFCVERFQNLNRRNDLPALITMGLACALASMHYLVARVVMLGILAFYLLDLPEYWNRDIMKMLAGLFERIKGLGVIILSMAVTLLAFFPPNLCQLFNVKFIYTGLGEYNIGLRDILYGFWHNTHFFINGFILGRLQGPSSDILLVLPFPIDSMIVIALVVLGFVLALRQRREVGPRLFVYLTFVLILVNLMSRVDPLYEYALSSCMMMTRLFLFLPLISIFAALGLEFIYRVIDRRGKKFGLAFALILISLIIFRVDYYFMETKRFGDFMSSLNYSFNKPAIRKRNPLWGNWGDQRDYPVAEKREMLFNQIYYRYLAKFVAAKIKGKRPGQQGIKIIYLPADYYTPEYYRYGGGDIPYLGHPYYFPVYLTLYLGDEGVRVNYLITKADHKNTIHHRFAKRVKDLPLIGGPWHTLTKGLIIDVAGRYVTSMNGLTKPQYVLATTPDELKASQTLAGAKVILKMPEANK